MVQTKIFNTTNIPNLKQIENIIIFVPEKPARFLSEQAGFSSKYIEMRLKK